MNVCVFQKKKKGSICSEMPLSCFSANFPQAVLSPGEIPNPWDFFQLSSLLRELQAPNQETEMIACYIMPQQDGERQSDFRHPATRFLLLMLHGAQRGIA